MQTCSKCRIEKPFTDFYRHTKRGYQAYCKPCTRAHREEWLVRNPGYAREWYQRNAKSEAQKQRLRKYKMSQEDFDKMIEGQQYRCAGCDRPLAGVGDIDHCHATGRVRAVLCRPCNTTLGHFNEDATLLRKLADYAETVCS